MTEVRSTPTGKPRKKTRKQQEVEKEQWAMYKENKEFDILEATSGVSLYF